MQPKTLRFLFIISDVLTASIAWMFFFYFRKVFVENIEFTVEGSRFFIGAAIVPVYWLIIYYVVGTYTNFRRIYFMPLVSKSLISYIIGVLGIFFFLILDDNVWSYQDYYILLLAIFTFHSVLSIIPRLLLTRYIVRNISKRKTGFNTLLIGGSKKAVQIYKELENLPKGTGSIFTGFINLNGVDNELVGLLPHLGHYNEIEKIFEKYEIEEVIIALDTSEQERLKYIISQLQGRDIHIKITSNMFDLLSGQVKMTNIFGALLIEINDQLMPHWQFVFKRCIDLIVSIIATTILIPVYLLLSILVKSSSKGPIFFKQERIGKNGVPFFIIKFRTMFVDAEKNGPELSSSMDKRVTKIGKTMRKYRLDETPQFWNVIKGEMSLVGPRPERQFFITQITEKEPQFIQLNKVKPGITSWGQVKFGYAENIEEMLQRMKFDLLYLKNMSIALDLKILLYTVIIVCKGSGK